MRRLVSLAITLGALPLAAQSVRGTVRAVSGNGPLGGAVVQLLDSASNERARALTREDGTFILRGAPGRYRVMARDIGYRPATTAAFDLRADTTVTIALARLPLSLATMRVLGKNPCDARPDTSSATWVLWDQATTAMLGASIALGDREKQFKFVLSSRDYLLNPTELEKVQFADAVLEGDKPWASLDPDTLALRGYVFKTDSGTMYYAPELDALLSRSFMTTHCFSIHKARGAGGTQLGVDFKPAPGVRHADIEGTVWLDEPSRELRTLEFTYANLAIVKKDTLAGGRVEFRRLAGGEWIIPSWTIRAPIASRVYDVNQILGSLNGAQPVVTRSTLSKIRVKRGDLVAAIPPGRDEAAPLWSRATGTLRLRVTSPSGTRADAPLPGATVRLPDSNVQAVSDSSGIASVGGLVDGDYFVDVTTPWYEALMQRPERFEVSMRDGGRVERQVRVASVEQVVRAICGGKLAERAAQFGLLKGTVVRDGVPEAGAVVTVEFPAGQSPDVENSVRTGAGGTFTFCKVPRNVQLNIRVVTKDGVLVNRAVAIARDQVYLTTAINLGTASPR